MDLFEMIDLLNMVIFQFAPSTARRSFNCAFRDIIVVHHFMEWKWHTVYSQPWIRCRTPFSVSMCWAKTTAERTIFNPYRDVTLCRKQQAMLTASHVSTPLMFTTLYSSQTWHWLRNFSIQWACRKTDLYKLKKTPFLKFHWKVEVLTGDQEWPGFSRNI